MRILSTALACLLLFSCNKYEDGPFFSLLSAKNRLDGEWEVTKVNHAPPQNTIDLINYNLTWEFDKDGDFKFDVFIGGEGNGGVNDLTGVWEFDNNKEEIEISLDNSPIMQSVIELFQLPSPLIPNGEFDILKLTNQELWLELDTSRIELEKIN